MSKKPKPKPKAGDKFFPEFASDLDDLKEEGREPDLLTIAEVEDITDTPGVWMIKASDGNEYDCLWSEDHQIWCSTYA